MPPDTHATLLSPELTPRANASQADINAVVAALRDASDQARAQGGAAVLEALVEQRRRAFAVIPKTPRPDWPPAYPDPFPGRVALPEIAAAALSPEILGGALLHHGSLIVRGLTDAASAARLQQQVDEAFAARDRFKAGAPASETSPLYSPVPGDELAGTRQWAEQCDAMWSADSPRTLAEIIALFQQAGVIDTIAGYLGERPALSVVKSTLRRVPVTAGGDWHQDGAFLGEHIRSVNVWLALSDCGEDAAGLDIVSRRLPYVLQSGSHGSFFDWSVGGGIVALLQAGGARIESPVFKAGDALLFDHLMLHRTALRPGMTKQRWASENWFFAPSRYPMDQVPLVI